VGVPGELHISGAGVARGYLNRPDLTAEKFIPNSFSAEPGTRLYKTGDLVRYLPDGNLEFVGRVDEQVKVRGHRIEPGEIEAMLREHPAVREAVVLAMADTANHNPALSSVEGSQFTMRLVAYVVPHQQPAPTPAELRSFLQGKLPDYMVPAAFVVLDALPLTPSGKVDRRVLPALDGARPELRTTYVAPRTLTEQAVAEIFGQILGIEQVGIHNSFFELGGHSLLATQVASRLRNTFEVELPLRTLFEAPTVAKLAESIETIRWVAQSRPTPANATTDEREEGEI
jgi:acyl carrier protein